MNVQNDVFLIAPVVTFIIWLAKTTKSDLMLLLFLSAITFGKLPKILMVMAVLVVNAIFSFL